MSLYRTALSLTNGVNSPATVTNGHESDVPRGFCRDVFHTIEIESCPNGETRTPDCLYPKQVP